MIIRSKIGIVKKNLIKTNQLSEKILERHRVMGTYFYRGASITYLKQNQGMYQELITKHPIFITMQLLSQKLYWENQTSIVVNRSLFQRIFQKQLEQAMETLRVEYREVYPYFKSLKEQIYHLENNQERMMMQMILSIQMKQLKGISKSEMSFEERTFLKQLENWNVSKKEFLAIEPKKEKLKFLPILASYVKEYEKVYEYEKKLFHKLENQYLQQLENKKVIETIERQEIYNDLTDRQEEMSVVGVQRKLIYELINETSKEKLMELIEYLREQNVQSIIQKEDSFENLNKLIQVYTKEETKNLDQEIFTKKETTTLENVYSQTKELENFKQENFSIKENENFKQNNFFIKENVKQDYYQEKEIDKKQLFSIVENLSDIEIEKLHEILIEIYTKVSQTKQEWRNTEQFKNVSVENVFSENISLEDVKKQNEKKEVFLSILSSYIDAYQNEIIQIVETEQLKQIEEQKETVKGNIIREENQKINSVIGLERKLIYELVKQTSQEELIELMEYLSEHNVELVTQKEDNFEKLNKLIQLYTQEKIKNLDTKEYQIKEIQNLEQKEHQIKEIQNLEQKEHQIREIQNLEQKEYQMKEIKNLEQEVYQVKDIKLLDIKQLSSIVENLSDIEVETLHEILIESYTKINEIKEKNLLKEQAEESVIEETFLSILSSYIENYQNEVFQIIETKQLQKIVEDEIKGEQKSIKQEQRKLEQEKQQEQNNRQEITSMIGVERKLIYELTKQISQEDFIKISHYLQQKNTMFISKEQLQKLEEIFSKQDWNVGELINTNIQQQSSYKMQSLEKLNTKEFFHVIENLSDIELQAIHKTLLEVYEKFNELNLYREYENYQQYQNYETDREYETIKNNPKKLAFLEKTKLFVLEQQLEKVVLKNTMVVENSGFSIKQFFIQKGKTSRETSWSFLQETRQLRSCILTYVKQCSLEEQTEFYKQFLEQFSEQLHERLEKLSQTTFSQMDRETRKQLQQKVIYESIKKADYQQLRRIFSQLLNQVSLEKREQLFLYSNQQNIQEKRTVLTKQIGSFIASHVEILEKPYFFVIQKQQLINLIYSGNRQELSQIFSYLSLHRMLEKPQWQIQDTEEIRHVLYKEVHHLTREQVETVFEDVVKHLVSVRQWQQTNKSVMEDSVIPISSQNTSFHNTLLEDIHVIYKEQENKVKQRKEVEEVVEQYIVTEKQETKQIKHVQEKTVRQVTEQAEQLEQLKETLEKQSVLIEDLKKKQTTSSINKEEIYKDVAKRMEKSLRLERQRRGLD